jgi:hypothetical protein
MNPTTDAARTEHLISTMTEQFASLTRTLSNWMQEQEHSLAEVEHHVVRLLKELGASLVAGLCSLAAPAQPSRTLPCSCGQAATYQRERKAQITTLLGSITIWRSYYLCPACGLGQHPLDAHLQICAGSRSAALDELLALLGATQDSFAQAAQVLERLTLVHLSANSVRDATHQLGALLLEQQPQPLAQPLPTPAPCPKATASSSPLYITMDGVLAHLHERGYAEIKVGCCYHTQTRMQHSRGEREEVRAHSASYLTSLAEAHTFGWQLWREGLRRGSLAAEQLVVLGDGAHWIWNIAEKHFPRATQILDWYHASGYVWTAASAIWGEASPRRAAWAEAQLEQLWQGKVAQVLVELEQWRERGEAVEAALSYYSEHQTRMDYASYRARGLQIGSGTVESACKQVVSARLKQAGMIWNAEGAEAVAVVRAWLKSERWEEAMALRGVRRRSYRRRSAKQEQGECEPKQQAADEVVQVAVKQQEQAERRVLSVEVLAQVRAELAEQSGKNVWRRAGSLKRQEQQAAQRNEPRSALAA